MAAERGLYLLLLYLMLPVRDGTVKALNSLYKICIVVSVKHNQASVLLLISGLASREAFHV